MADYRDPLIEEMFTPARWKLQRRIQSSILQAADRIIVASDELRSMILDQFPGQEEKYHVICNGFEPELFQQIPKELPKKFTLG